MNKIVLAALAAIALVTSSTFTASAQVTPITPSVQLLPGGSDLDVKVGIMHLSRESPANLAVQSSTWVAAANNAVSILLSGYQSAGSNQYDTAARASVLNYLKMITSTSFQSWDGLLHAVSGNNQFGNRVHFPVTISSNLATATFRLADTTITVRSLTRTSTGWGPDGAVNTTVTLNALNSNRLRLQPAGVAGIVGDTVHAIQDPLAQSQSAAFVGIGVALGAFGSGDSAAQLNNTLNYYLNGNFAVQVTVNVPYTDNGVSKIANGSTIFTSVWTQPEAGVNLPITEKYCTEAGDGLLTVSLGMMNGGQVPSKNLFQLQSSTTLGNWQSAGYPVQLGGQTTLTFPTGEMPGGSGPRCFYRIVDLLPPATVAARNANNAQGAIALPPADVIVP